MTDHVTHMLVSCARLPPLSQLAKAIRKVAEAPGMVMPEKIRFFRGQMQTIITRACGEVGVEPVPSRRCIALMSARPA